MSHNDTEPSHILLSVVIPTFNDACLTLVEELHDQCLDQRGLGFEILVGDDGSTATDIVDHNRAINTLTHCHYIEREENVGRAAIRNFLAREARGKWLLYIDSHMSVISANYIGDYLAHADDAPVVYGGYRATGDSDAMRGNLRWRYEQSCMEALSAEARRKSPYSNFHTSNFCIRRSVMLDHPLDERFTRYGYEDVLYGKTLKAAGVGIAHIDNPVGFSRYESNARFLEKTEEALLTLHEFCSELHDQSRMLQAIDRMRPWGLTWVARQAYRLLRTPLRNNLKGRHPSLRLFDLYRLGYYLSLKQ